MKKLLIFCSLLALAAPFSGCKKAEEAPDVNGGSTSNANLDTTIRINLGNEPKTLDPALVEDVASNKCMHGLMEGLVWLDGEVKPQPGVAERWEPSNGYKTWTFYLRKDARWHNGDPVTANDFKYSVERVCSPSTAANYAQIVYSVLDGGEEYFKQGGLDEGLSLDAVEVVDEYTIKYHTGYPAPFFPTLVAFGPFLPVHKPTIEEFGSKWSLSPDTYVGNGPFYMDDYRSRDRIILKPFEEYWDRDEIFWESVELHMIEEDNTELSAYQTGGLDVTETLAPSQIPFWKMKDDYRVIPSLNKYYVIFNNSVPPFDDVNVRKAFSSAIDRELIVEKITRAGERVSEGFVPHGMPGAVEGETFRQTAGNLIPSMDVEAAKQYLADSSYGSAEDLPSVTYMYNTAELHKVIGEQLQNMWREAFDIDVQLQNSEWGVVLGKIRKGDFQFARGSWIADYADPLNFLEIFTSDNSKNGAKYQSEKYDELIAKARVEGDPIRRQELFMEAERLLVEEDCAIAPLYTAVVVYLVEPDIEGLEVNALANMTYPRARRVGAK